MRLKRIYIIDDDPIYKLVTNKLIEKTNLFSGTRHFANGSEALHYFESTTDFPDILLLDLEMPEMDGWEFLDEFCQLKKKMENDGLIYIASSSIAHEDKMKAQKYKCVRGFLSKPINLDKLKKIADQD